MSASTAAGSSHQVRDQYMEHVTRLFESELVEIYEGDASASGDVMKHVRSCLEAGLAVWGNPMVLPPVDVADSSISA